MPKYESGRTRLTSFIEKKAENKSAGERGTKAKGAGPKSAAGLRYAFEFAEYLFDRLFRKSNAFKFIFAAACAGFIAAFIFILTSDFKKVKALAVFKPDVTTRIYDKNDVLIAELFKEKREPVKLEKIPKNLINAFTAAEDNEFYSHHGVNPKSILRAFFVNLMAGGVKQGGSTITQQLSKILLTSRERSIFRKMKEACIAVMMEFSYSKEEIMELYLNQIFLGHGAYGVESAAKLYFGKHVWECSLAECALLASLPSAPNLLSPIRHPENSMQRHKIVLAKMVEAGHISVKQAEEAYLSFWPDYLSYISGIEPTVTAWSSRVNEAPWFTEYIRRNLIKKYGEDTVYNEGLRVYTTLDLNKQKAGQKALWEALGRQTKVSGRLAFKNDDVFIDRFYDEVSLIFDIFDINGFTRKGSMENERINSLFRSELAEEIEGLNLLAGIDGLGAFMDSYKSTFSDDKELQAVEGALLSINHTNGYIEAMIGGSPFTSINQLNRAMQSKRQSGSAIKPLLYSAAIESREFTAATPVLDSPIVYLDNEGGSWVPENYEGDYQGLIPLRKALALSINVISVRIAEKLGIETVIKYYAKLLKIGEADMGKRIPRNFSIALGSLEVSPFELTRAYAIFANGGRDVIPFSVRYIKDRDGNLLENPEEEIRKRLEQKKKDGSIQVIKPETAQVMISLLKTVVEHGTGSRASSGTAAAGKTGTSNNWKDAWFVGFIPNLTTGIWIGYDKLGLSLGQGQTGGTVCAPVWGNYMRKAAEGSAPKAFPAYAELASAAVCARTGFLPSRSCTEVVREIFIPGTVPEKVCSACIAVREGSELPKKGPRENILREQKRDVLNSLKKDNTDFISGDVGDELLQ